MKIIEKIKEKSQNLFEKPSVTIAFLGDSVTQGCFENYPIDEKTMQTVFDYKSAYSTRVREILNFLYPDAQINVINSGISGDGAVRGAERYERDVSAYSPDLVVVSYGLNDSCSGKDGLAAYGEALSKIFEKAQKDGAECIFLTQNYMCEKRSPHLREELFRACADSFSDIQRSGVLDEYFEEAKKRCRAHGVRVCDVRSAWAKMSNGGVDVTELLANKLNHPVREMHRYMAIKLVETMFE